MDINSVLSSMCNNAVEEELTEGPAFHYIAKSQASLGKLTRS